MVIFGFLFVLNNLRMKLSFHIRNILLDQEHHLLSFRILVLIVGMVYLLFLDDISLTDFKKLYKGKVECAQNAKELKQLLAKQGG